MGLPLLLLFRLAVMLHACGVFRLVCQALVLTYLAAVVSCKKVVGQGLLWCSVRG